MTTIIAPSASVRIARSILLEALQRVSHAIGPAKTLPVLGCVRIERSARNLTLTATDLDRTITTAIPCDGGDEESGVWVVPAKALLAIVSQLPPAPVTLDSVAGSKSIRVSAGRASLELPGFDASEFPLGQGMPKGRAVEMATAGILAAIGRVAPHAFDGESRPTITGVCLECSKAGMTIAATDGHGAHRERISDDSQMKGQWIIPTSTASALAKIYGKVETMRVSTDATTVGFTDGTTTLVSRIIEGPFPALDPLYKGATDAEKIQATVDRDLLIATIRRVASVPGVIVARFTFEEGEVRVSADGDEGGSAEDAVPCAIERTKNGGASLAICFDPPLLLRSLASITSSEVRIGLAGPERAALLRDPSKNDGFSGGLVMPRRDMGLTKSRPRKGAR